MSIRAMCGMGSILSKRAGIILPPSSTRVRTFHVVSAQPQSTQDLAGMFSEVFSAHPTPDKINTLMNRIYTDAPHNNVTSFSLLCRAFTDRWSIKGLRIGPKGNSARKRSVVLVSGLHALERIPIGVNLFVAAALSRRPLEGVEVTVFPIMKPKEYEMEWRHEQARTFLARQPLPSSSSSSSSSSSTGAPIKLSLDEYEGGIDGPLRNYVLKRSTNFVDVGMDLGANHSTLRLKSNSLARPLQRAEVFLQGMREQEEGGGGLFPPLSPSLFASSGETTLFGAVAAPPALVLELRDRRKVLDEEQISSCGEQVLTALEQLIEDTNGPRGFVL